MKTPAEARFATLHLPLIKTASLRIVAAAAVAFSITLPATAADGQAQSQTPRCIIPSPLNYDVGVMQAFYTLNNGGTLIGGNNGWYYLAPRSKHLMRVDDSHGIVQDGRVLPDGDILIGFPDSWWRFDLKSQQLVPAGTKPVGSMYTGITLPDGNLLFRGRRHWLRYDPNAKKVLSVENTKLVSTSYKNKFYPLSNGMSAILMPSGKGSSLVLFDSSKGSFRAVPTDQAGTVWSVATTLGHQLLVGAGRGVFVLDPVGVKLLPLWQLPTNYSQYGEVFISFNTARSGVVFPFVTGGPGLNPPHVWRYDESATRLIDIVGQELAGDSGLNMITLVANLDDGSFLAFANPKSDGLYLYDVKSNHIVQIAPASKITGIASDSLRFDNFILISSASGWFDYDIRRKSLNAIGRDIPPSIYDLSASTNSVLMLSPTSVLLSNKYCPLYFDFNRHSIIPLTHCRPEEEFSSTSPTLSQISKNKALILTKEGSFEFDVPTSSVVSIGPTILGDPADGSANIVALPVDGAIIQSSHGWFRLRPSIGHLEEMHDPDLGGEVTLMPVEGKGAVIIAHNKIGRIRTAESALDITMNSGLHPTATPFEQSGGLEIEKTDSGWYLWDPSAGMATLLGDAAGGDLQGRADLPNGGTLLFTQDSHNTGSSGTQSIVELVTGTWNAARTALDFDPITLHPSKTPVAVSLTLTDQCSIAAGGMALSLLATHDGAFYSKTPVRLSKILGDETSDNRIAVLTSDIRLDHGGAWSIQLTQGDLPIGKALPFHVSTKSLAQILKENQDLITKVGSALYTSTFLILLFLTRWHSWAFRLVSDPAWGRLLNWPFFFLRHVPLVQRWILEPWFIHYRKSFPVDVRFFDPPVAGENLSSTTGDALLEVLSNQKRLWLHGRSGMGKSSVFDAWERTYFDGDPSSQHLGACIHRFGFILIPLRMRRYAHVSSPDPARPESWVVEIVRRRLEEFGVATRDAGLVEAMLRAGRIALAIDGVNEVEKDEAVYHFAQQFPTTRLLVTSRSLPESGWQIWRLPSDISSLRESLLCLWLGNEGGRRLALQVAESGLRDSLVSGYDLRLLVDLVVAAPGSELPSTRSQLYREMLIRAKNPDGELLDLAPLKRLAWTMMLERRRQMAEADELALNAGTLDALAQEGVRVTRRVMSRFEFRHDQMRAFLAALWLVDELPSQEALFRTLAESKVFDLSRADQNELWGFLAPLLDSDEQLVSVWLFAGQDAANRGILLAALQVVATGRSLPLMRPADTTLGAD